jgi:hypothetical protein
MIVCMLSASAFCAMAAEVLVEAESFAEKGGWVVDQQYIESMGSPYLLAHGLGEPVSNAVANVEFPSAGTYAMWVRTKDWVPGTWTSPGRFEVLVDGTAVGTTFGTVAGWTWQAGGIINVADTNVTISLHDLTGFDGRCDALYFNTDPSAVPPDFDASDRVAHRQWRNGLLGLPATPPDAGRFDVVIVGGGIAGCAAALAADEEGLSVALIQDRPLLGGNASSEIRVHTEGIHGQGGDILEQIDTEHYENGSADALLDQAKREATMAAATNINIFSSHRAYDVQMNGSTIESVDAVSVLTGEALRFHSDVFIDCTGDGWIGYWAGADYSYGRESKDEFGEEWATYGDLWSPTVADNRVMGSSLLWYSKTGSESVVFPEVPWAMDVALTHSATEGGWRWEYSDNDKHQIDDAEEIRDHMLRAIYGSFYNAKQNAANDTRELDWVGYLNGKRESRRLMGDYIYKMSDATSGTLFDDAVVQETRSIDVHYQQILNGDSTVDFLSEALFKSVPTYYVPFRCLYSRNINNLMMAGRCFSCTHIGMGGPRVMNTCGQMGIATGYAASLCKKYSSTPLGIYTSHIAELKDLVNNVVLLDSSQREEVLATFEFTGGTLTPTLGDYAAASSITVSGLSTGNYGDLFDNGGDGNHLRISGDDTDNSAEDALTNGTYLSFSVTNNSGEPLILSSFSATIYATNTYNYSNARIYSSVQGFDDAVEDSIGVLGRSSTGTDAGWAVQTLDLVGLGNDDQGAHIAEGDFVIANGESMTFYIPWIDASNVDYRYTDIDDLSIFATVPLDADSDGMPDDWETAHGLAPDVNDGSGDADLDGKSNVEEYLADTDPQDPDSKQTSSVNQGPGVDEMNIAFSTSSNRLYTVDYCDDLTADTWLSFQSQFVGTGSATNFVDSATSNRFYRLQIHIP